MHLIRSLDRRTVAFALRCILLVFAIFCGLFVGAMFFWVAPNRNSLLFFECSAESRSLLDTLCVVLLSVLPFVICALLGRSILVCPFVFIKSILFSFGIFSAFFAFGGGAWFADFVLRITSYVSYFLLLVFSVIYYVRQRHISLGYCVLTSAIIFCIALVDHCIISPYFTSIFER